MTQPGNILTKQILGSGPRLTYVWEPKCTQITQDRIHHRICSTNQWSRHWVASRNKKVKPENRGQVLNIWLRSLDNDDFKIREYFLSRQMWSELLFRRPWNLMRPQRGRQRRQLCYLGEKTHTGFFLWWPRDLSGSSAERRPFVQSASWAQDEVCSKRHLSTAVGFSLFLQFHLHSTLGISVLPPVTVFLVPPALPLLATLSLLPFSFPALGICMLIWSVEMLLIHVTAELFLRVPW